MKTRRAKKRNGGLTLNEMLVVIVMLFILAALFLPAINTTHHPAYRIHCVSNLRQVGLAYQIWAGDHGDKFPMQVSINDTNGSGTMELADGRNAWINFAILSNELSTPKILYCPADKDRSAATNFSTDFNNSKLSYFAALDATNDTNPQMILSGDDNFALSGIPVKYGLLEIPTNAPIAWTAARHKLVGNITLADGSVQQVTINGLQQILQNSGVATNRLAIP